MLLEELLDGRISHDRFPWARSRAAAPNAANSACENGLLITCHSGCHCTATAKSRASADAKSLHQAVRAHAPRFRAHRRVSAHPARAREFTRMRSLPASRCSTPPGTSSTSCAGPYCTSSGSLLVLAVIREPGHLVHLLPERTAEGDVHFLEAAADAEQRHAARDRKRYERQGRGVAMRVVRRASVAGRAGIAMRLDVRGAAGQEHTVDAFEQLLDRDQRIERGNQHRDRIRCLAPLPRCISRRHNGRDAGPVAGDPRECRSAVCARRTFKILDGPPRTNAAGVRGLKHRPGG